MISLRLKSIKTGREAVCTFTSGLSGAHTKCLSCRTSPFGHPGRPLSTRCSLQCWLYTFQMTRRLLNFGLNKFSNKTELVYSAICFRISLQRTLPVTWLVASCFHNVKTFCVRILFSRFVSLLESGNWTGQVKFASVGEPSENVQKNAEGWREDEKVSEKKTRMTQKEQMAILEVPV